MTSHYADGEWNFTCDLCGRIDKSSRARKTWDNHWVCEKHKEVRNPQDFVKGVKDDQSVPWSRVEVAPTYVSTSTPILDTYGDFLSDIGSSPIFDVGV